MRVDVMGAEAADEAERERRSTALTEVSTFEALYQAESGRVFAVVLALTGDRATAEDLTQEAFAAAHRRWSKVSGYEQPGAWVRRVAVNAAISRFRRHRSERRALERVHQQPVPASDGVPNRLDEELWAAVRSLPDRQAQAIALTYVEDLSVAQVAAVLGCSDGAVKRHLARGRATLQTRLASSHHDREGGAR